MAPGASGHLREDRACGPRSQGDVLLVPPRPASLHALVLSVSWVWSSSVNRQVVLAVQDSLNATGTVLITAVKLALVQCRESIPVDSCFV